MSEHESETHQEGSEASWEAASPFSANGNGQAEPAVATDVPPAAELDDRAAFLSDLARVMRSTAATEQARNAEATEQRRQTHVDGIRAREAAEAEEYREIAKRDVEGIDAWSEEEIQRIKLERERRIAARREQLQLRLEDHRSIVAREVEAVEAAVAAYRLRTDEFFRGLEAETDPVAIARRAGTQPAFPDLSLIGPDDAPARTPYGYELSATSDAEAVGPDREDGDGPHDDTPSSGDDQPMVGVMDPDSAGRSAETPWDPGVAAGSGSGPEGSSGSGDVEEPSPVVAEAKVVMPRASGVGSWLRWPTHSANHSDARR